VITQHPRTHLDELTAQMRVEIVRADDPTVDSMVNAYRERFRLGPRVIAAERADLWRGVIYKDRIVAAFGEHTSGQMLEITDAYREESPAGLAAFANMSYHYLALARSGEVEKLVHTILFENMEHWRAIVRESGDWPFALIFIHTKKGEPDG
jgi:hypothetical protein